MDTEIRITVITEALYKYVRLHTIEFCVTEYPTVSETFTKLSVEIFIFITKIEHNLK